jgi:hypothetical protein
VRTRRAASPAHRIATALAATALVALAALAALAGAPRAAARTADGTRSAGPARSAGAPGHIAPVRAGWTGARAAAPAAPPTTLTAPPGSPGATEPGSDGGTADALWFPVAALAAAGVLTVWAMRRRRVRPRPVHATAGRGPADWRTRPKQPVPVTPLPELDAQSHELLVATDDAVRTSGEDVALAAAQCGDDAALPFAEAVEYARGELSAAFRLRQRLDDAGADDDAARRQMLDEILSRCTQADRRLDAEADAFDRLRQPAAHADVLLERARARAAALPEEIAGAEAALRRAGERYAAAALSPVVDRPAEARDRLAFARAALERARAALDGGDDESATVFLRAAEGALGQAEVLARSAVRRTEELRSADAALHEALAAAAADLAEARQLLAARPAARAEAALAAVRDELAGGRPDPVAALRRVGVAEAALDRALAGARDEVESGRRAEAILERALLTARTEVEAVRDEVTTHRGAVGSGARTRLAEAERRLRKAQALAVGGPSSAAYRGDPRAALGLAREADRLARDALEYAREDVARFTGPRPGTGGAGAPSEVPGLAGAVLGGILPPACGRSAGRTAGGFGGAGPGSFGGSRTRGRMGGGRP